jgi:hypothetical protein
MDTDQKKALKRTIELARECLRRQDQERRGSTYYADYITVNVVEDWLDG